MGDVSRESTGCGLVVIYFLLVLTLPLWKPLDWMRRRYLRSRRRRR